MPRGGKGGNGSGSVGGDPIGGRAAAGGIEGKCGSLDGGLAGRGEMGGKDGGIDGGSETWLASRKA